ncbi:MAG: lantibiotic dehydratase family protein [Bacteroidales bacterium]|nr:lantibiotic dehydratase family protein [Bacteroidales bacterium]
MMNKQNSYKPFKNFILRTPLKPVNHLSNFLLKTESSGNLLGEILENKIIKEAFYLASPNLFSKIIKQTEGKITDKKEIQKLEQSVFKYISRLSSRSTPFGLFASVSAGELSDKTDIKLPPVTKNKRNLRLDMNYLVSLSIELSKVPEIKKQLKFYPNSSLYTVDDKLRYVEYQYIKSKRVHHIVAVDNSEYLERILKVAEKGADIKNLTEVLIDDEITYEEAESFINELIESQILISELEPAVTGDDFLNQILNVINKFNGVNSYKLKIQNLINAIEDVNSLQIGIDITKYEQITGKIKDLYPEFDTKYMFQADMLKPVKDLTVSHKITEDILKGIEVLNRFTEKPTETNLTRFKDAFYERYEDAEIPLLNALDTELGIGYLQDNSGTGVLSPLVDDLFLPGTGNNIAKINWTSVNSFLLKKCNEAIKDNKHEIIITDNEIKKYTKEAVWNDLPATIHAMVQIYKSGSNEEIFLQNAGGSSAVNLLGRFAHTDNRFKELIKNVIDYEENENSDKIFAEIVHLPESRTGNILLRPAIRKHEIPYLAKSAVDDEYTIHPKDLMISVKRNKIILRSKKLNKEIIPRLGNAHNYSFNALPVYQFLCDMQTQNLRGGIGFYWGPLENEFKFLPRVKYKNIIFSFAKWRIIKEDFEHILKIKDDKKLLSEIKTWREMNNIPVWAALEDGDNKLTLNFENLLSIKTLISLIKNRQNFILSEFILNEQNAFIKDKEDYFANEFIFAFKKTNNITL